MADVLGPPRFHAKPCCGDCDEQVVYDRARALFRVPTNDAADTAVDLLLTGLPPDEAYRATLQRHGAGDDDT